MPLLAAAVRRAFGAPASSPFAVPESVWTTLSQRVHLVLNAKLRGGPYAPFLSLPSYGAMFDSCAAWRESTFSAIVAVSREVERYARETVARQYPLLEDALARRDASSVATIVAQLERDAGVVVALAKGLAERVEVFHQASKNLDREFEKRPESAWLLLVPKPKAAADAVNLLYGTWNSLASDLQTVHAAIFNGSAMDDLNPSDIAAAREGWTAFAAEASDFIRMADGQHRVLDGLFIAPIVHILAGNQPGGTIRLQSHRDIGVRKGDRLIVFGVGPVDGRHELVNVTAPAPREFPLLWSYFIKTTARPKNGWMTYDGIRWLRTPLAAASSPAIGWALATIDSCEAAGARTIVRVGEELPLDIGARINVARPDFGGNVVERQQTTNLAGDRFWHYTLDTKLPAGANPTAVWAGMYREDA